LVKPAGKYWRWDYRYIRKRKTLALGVDPVVAPHFSNALKNPHRRSFGDAGPGLQIRQKLSSLGPILAFDAPSPTDA